MRNQVLPFAIRNSVTTNATEHECAASPDDLAQALHVIIGWYEDPLGGGLPKRHTPPRGVMRLGEVVRQYLATRSEWENREAFILADRMGGRQCETARKGNLRDRRAS